MKDGLRTKLISAIKTHGRITYGEMEQFCEDNGYRKSNGERRLREAMDRTHHAYDPTIQTERNEKGIIIAYFFRPVQEKTSQVDKTIVSRKKAPHRPNFNDSAIPPIYCCEVNAYYPGNHSIGCATKNA